MITVGPLIIIGFTILLLIVALILSWENHAYQRSYALEGQKNSEWMRKVIDAFVELSTKNTGTPQNNYCRSNCSKPVGEAKSSRNTTEDPVLGDSFWRASMPDVFARLDAIERKCGIGGRNRAD